MFSLKNIGFTKFFFGFRLRIRGFTKSSVGFRLRNICFTCALVISDVVEHKIIRQNIAFSGYVQQCLAVSGYTQVECLKEQITTRHSSLSR